MKTYKYEFLKGREAQVAEPLDFHREFEIKNLFAIHYNNFAPKFKFAGTFERHNLFEFFYVAAGKMVAKIEKETYKMEAGDYVLVPPMLYHVMEPNKCYCTGIAIIFDATDYPESLFFGKLSDFGKQLLSNVLRIYAKNCSESTFHLMLLPSEEEKDYAFGQALLANVELLMILVLQDLKNEELKTAPPPLHDTDPLATEIFEYLKAHYTENPSLVELAEHFNYSVPHICRVFKRCYNDSIVNYLLKIKINEAMKLIEQNNKSLGKICEMLGFDDMAYFSRTFKRLTGMTPSTYRQNATWTHLINSKYLPENLRL